MLFLKALGRTKGAHVERCQERANRGLCGFLRLTLDHCRWAYGSWARSRRWALRGRWTLDNRATRARAWGALARFRLTLAIVDNHRLGLWDTALQDILA
jgi:hypothetical protein